ncbi:MAG: ABC transporter substrate-binding protein [Bacilli bacterium]|nr:ABC transporter substrate-binding protein [Bacilli bacterium]
MFLKKILFLIILLIFICLTSYFIFHEEKQTKLKNIKVAEVTHSIFYAPQYLAQSLGYFEEEGLNVEIILTAGADKVTTAVLSNDVQIGFCGSEATIYVYNNGEKDYLINFAGLTKKDGSFLVSRKKINNFKLTDLKNKHIIAGRKAGMPALTLEYALNKNGLDTEDFILDTSIDFSSMAGAFIGGTGDFVTLFEPTALQIEKQGYGFVVASVGELGGIVPYTTYNARKSYIEKNPQIIKSFTKAIDKALIYVHNHNANEIANKILNYFPDNSLNDITKVVQRYIDIDAWFNSTKISENDFKHVQEIIDNAGELENFVSYEKLVNNSFSK